MKPQQLQHRLLIDTTLMPGTLFRYRTLSEQDEERAANTRDSSPPLSATKDRWMPSCAVHGPNPGEPAGALVAALERSRRELGREFRLGE